MNDTPTVILVSIHPNPSPQAIPLANAFIKSFTSGCSCKTELLDFFSSDSPEHCTDKLCTNSPAAIGFSMYVWNREHCLKIARQIRDKHPEIILFAGGPEPTADPAGVLGSNQFDCIVCGEGEQPCLELFERIAAGAPLTGISGIATPDHPDVLQIQPTGDLDAIPSPYLNGVLSCSHYQGILWQLSRGCGFACDFCFDARGSRQVRRFSQSRIEAELRHFVEHGVNQVFVLDSTFNQETKRAKAILRLIARIAPQIHFHFEVRSEFIDREMAELFAGITCSIQIGLQSADPKVLAGVGRSFKAGDFKTRVSLLNETGATFGFDLMYGLPGDTLQGFRKSLDFSLALYPNHLDIFPLAILPGTALADRGKSAGMRYLDSPPYTLIESATFTVNDMAIARRLANACDIFYTRGRAVAWFNSILNVMQLTAASFLEQFADWLQNSNQADLHEKDLDDGEIKQLQLGFLNQQFATKRLKRYLPLVSDLLEYHFCYAAALLAPPCCNTGKKQPGDKLAELPLSVAPAVQLTDFNYEILELLELGAPDIPWIQANLKQCGSHALIYPHNGEICTESLDRCYITFMRELNGKVPAREIARSIGLADDIRDEFLEFAWGEGLLIKPA